MKRLIISLFAAIVAVGCCCSCERIDAGYEGIRVNLYGSNKGIDDVELVTGMVWYNPFTTSVYEYPTFVQTIDYPPFSVNAKDGSSFTVDPTISLKIIDGHAADVFRKYRKDDIEEVINTTLYNYVKNAFRIELNRYTTDELVSKREEFEQTIEDRLTAELEREFFHLEQMTSGLQYPATLVAAIDAKNKAVQDALKIENEVKAVEANAKKAIAEADGAAKALKIKGDAEAEYNRKIAASLSPLIIDQNMIDKWDGKLPVYGTTPTLFRDLGK
jgi:regulator of protease activity HflC (stomatin/prohibitin superfamily)